MIKNTLLAATIASGLIVPAKAGVYLPPKPAIIKPENIEFSKNMLAFPFTLGMLPGKGASGPLYISDTDKTETSNSTSTRTWSHTTTSDTRCLVVAYGYRTTDGYKGQFCNFNGVSMTQPSGAYIPYGSTPGGAAGIFYLFDPPIGTFTVSLSTFSNQRVGASSINITGTSLGPVAETSGTSSSISSSVVTTQAAVVIAASVNIQTSTSTSSMTGTPILDHADGVVGYGISYTEPASAGTQSFTHTYSGSSRKAMAMAAFY